MTSVYYTERKITHFTPDSFIEKNGYGIGSTRRVEDRRATGRRGIYKVGQSGAYRAR